MASRESTRADNTQSVPGPPRRIADRLYPNETNPSFSRVINMWSARLATDVNSASAANVATARVSSKSSDSKRCWMDWRIDAGLEGAPHRSCLESGRPRPIDDVWCPLVDDPIRGREEGAKMLGDDVDLRGIFVAVPKRKVGCCAWEAGGRHHVNILLVDASSGKIWTIGSNRECR